MKQSTIKLLLLISLISLVSLIIHFIFKPCECKQDYKENNHSYSNDTKNVKGIKGICYFDIDDTLTTASGNTDEIIQECIDNNFAVGIITASGRTIEDICTGDKAGGKEPGSNTWMSNILCKQFNKNPNMYNSTSTVAGSVQPIGWPSDKIRTDPGFVKGFDMKYGRDNFYSDVPDKCVVLFDDQPSYIEGVKKFNKNFEIGCSNFHCGANRVLDKEMVRKKLEEMKKNGCM
jgi:hypothetical protein